jgi:hypothetical protein
LLRELGDVKATLERRANSLQGTLTNQLAALEPLLPTAYQKLANSIDSFESAGLAWASRLGLADGDTPWDEAREALSQAAGASDDQLDCKRGALAALRDDFRQLDASWDATTIEYPEAISERIEALGTGAPANDLELLRHAQRHFESAQGDTCPVCEQPIDWAKTKTQLKERIDSLAEYGELWEQRATAVRGWWSRWSDLSRLQGKALAEIGEPAAWRSLGPSLPGLDLLLQPKTATIESARLRAIMAVGGRQLEKFLRAASEELGVRTEMVSATLPRAEQLPEINLCASLFARIAQRRPGLKLVESELAAVRAEQEVQTAIYEAVRKARQDVARSTLDKIAKRVADFYFAMHPPGNPEEATGAPSIDVQRHSGGTAFVRGMFAQKSVKDPRWVYSDGHLDTVGICIFLALRRFRADGDTDAKLLILDDIIISIDLGHARRLLELLRDEFADHQIIILTHNRLFAHWCVGIIPDLARLEIRSWTLDAGPRLGEHRDAYEALEASLETDTPKEISQHMVTLLDEWLSEARFALQLSVHAKRDEAYTLTDIWEPFVAALRKMAKVMNSDLGGALRIVDGLRDVPKIRNYLSAHENDFAREFPRETMIEVSRRVLGLVDALYCRACRSFAEPVPRRSDPSIVHCRCKKIQYVPRSPN